MRPVSTKFPVSQAFGSGATAGIDPYGDDPMAPYVLRYGNYQPYGHAGMDIACPVGTPVYAMASGTVLWADWGTNLPGDDSGAGWASRWYLYKGFPGIVTLIQHPWGIGVYAHLSNNDAAPAGTYVKEGQLIGLSGNTGGVDAHLHVEALINLSYVTQGNLIYGRTDPAPFFGTLTPQSTTTAPAKATAPKDDDMPTYKRVPAIVRKPGATKLGAGRTWYLKDKAGARNLNLSPVAGMYDVDLFLSGTGLAAGEALTVQFVIATVAGKRSGYFSQDIPGTNTGAFRGHARFSMPVPKGAFLEVAVTSSATGPDLTIYGADVKVWQ